MTDRDDRIKEIRKQFDRGMISVEKLWRSGVLDEYCDFPMKEFEPVLRPALTAGAKKVCKPAPTKKDHPRHDLPKPANEEKKEIGPVIPLYEFMPTPAPERPVAGNGRFIMSTEELILFLDAGASTAQIAEHIGISTRAVRKRIAQLKVFERELHLIESTPEGTRVLNTPEQLTAINKAALEGALDKRLNIQTKISLTNRVEKQNEF